MKPLSRRSVTTGLVAAGVAAIPAVGLCVGSKEHAYERIRRLTAELEQAMREAYDANDLRVGSWGPHNPFDQGDGVAPVVFVVAHKGKRL
jgi:hypothetical protein